MTKILSEVEARRVISAGKIGHLGCIVKGEPYVVPVNYLLEDGSIYSHSLPGQKIQALRTHPRVCLQVEQIHDDFHWRSAIAFGSFEEIHDELERALALRKLLERFPRLTPVESRVVQDAAPLEVIVFRIRVDRVTGVGEE
jgi:nitroimidazol reductase NimA-like FMN-containing flavoprotein (pyridoxamine 5'-phosphate oxidase superfamily)